jgi:hydroxyethylthiazole kinase-like uncharacterized protein yjeF
LPLSSGLLGLEKRSPITAERMREREEFGVSLGVTRLTMMENAGAAVASFAAGLVESQIKILLLAGTGNNGGDVFVAARHLTFWKDFAVSLCLVGSERDIRAEEAATNWRILKGLARVKKSVIDSLEKLDSLREEITDSRVIVAGIFGTGFKGSPRELQKHVIEMINASTNSKKISVDIPSGMEADTGKFETAVISDYTVTMDSPKVGMVANKRAKQICGEIVIANIGLPS